MLLLYGTKSLKHLNVDAKQSVASASEDIILQFAKISPHFCRQWKSEWNQIENVVQEALVYVQPFWRSENVHGEKMAAKIRF